MTEALNPSWKFKDRNQTGIINWVSRAWHSLTDDTIRHSFKACGISLVLDRSEDGLLNDRLATPLTGMDPQEGAQRAQFIFHSDSEDDTADFSEFSASESESDEQN